MENIISSFNFKEAKNISDEELIEIESIVHLKHENQLCGSCNENCYSSDQMTNHMIHKDEDLSSITCPSSALGLKLQQKSTLQNGSNLPFLENSIKNSSTKCPDCGKIFPKAKSLNRHWLLSHRKSTKFKCKNCKKKFNTKGLLNDHILKSHKSCDATKSAKSICPVCNKNFVSEKKLSMHIQSHWESKIEVGLQNKLNCSEKLLLTQSVPLVDNTQHDSEHKCSVCSNVYSSALKLTLHLESHDKQLKQRFPCNGCDMTFSYKSQLRVHSLTHTGEKPFVCEVCGKRFKRLQQCKVHSKLVHSKNRVQCNECLKFFGTTSNLMRHRIAFHLNLKRWICGICSHSYAHSQDLRRHLKKVHTFELDSIDNKSKKSQSEIYIIPALNTFKISDEVKQKVEAIYQEESEKCIELNTIGDEEDKTHLTSISRPPNEEESVDQLVSYPVEALPLKECGYCKSRIDTCVAAVKCDTCSLVMCCQTHLNMHISEVHNIIFQCFSCNVNFVSKELCFSHIEKCHSYSQSLYQTDFQPSPLISCLVDKGVTMISSAPQVTAAHIIPRQNPIYQLVTVPGVDQRSLVNVTGSQESVFVVPNTANKCLLQGVPLNSSVLLDQQQVVQVNPLTQNKLTPEFKINPCVNVANTLPVIEFPVDIAKPSDGFPFSLSSCIPQFSEPPVEDDYQSPKIPVESVAFQGLEHPIQDGTKEKQFVRLRSDVNDIEEATIGIQSAPEEANQCLQFPSKISNLPQMPLATAFRENTSAANVLLNLSGLKMEEQKLVETCEIPSELNRPMPVFTLHETSKGLPLNYQVGLVQTTPAPLSNLSFTGADTGTIPYGNTLQNTGFPDFISTKDVCVNSAGFNIPEEELRTSIKLEETPFSGSYSPEETNSSMLLTSGDDDSVSSLSSQSSPYQCTSCSKVFSTFPQLERHKRIHAPKKFQCTICDKSFVEKFNLKTHMMSHTQEKPRQCDKCDKKFRYFRDLKDHLHSHEGLLPFECESCSLKFLRRKDLVRHQKEQHGAAKYKCPECDREFKRKFYLDKVHMITHRPKSSGRKNSFPCCACEQEFGTRQEMKSHACSAPPLTCQVCGKTFKRKSSLAAHLKQHKRDSNPVLVSV